MADIDRDDVSGRLAGHRVALVTVFIHEQSRSGSVG